MQDAAKPALEIAGARVECGVGKRRRQQDDAEIGVLSHGQLGGLDGKPDALAYGKSFAPDQRGGSLGAGREVDQGHAVTVAEAMHVAGLQRVEFGKAGVKEASGDRLGA